MKNQRSRLFSPVRSVAGALYMLHKYTLGQIDTTSTVVWDAARAFVIGVAFVWSGISTPIQLLSGIMGASFVIIVIARYKRQPIPGYPIRTVFGEIARMAVTLLLVMMIRFAVQITNSSDTIQLVIVGMFAWLEVGTALVYVEHMGFQMPPIIVQLARAMFKIRNDALDRFITGRRPDVPGDPAPAPEKESGTE